jgi:hypothetical protein
MESNDPDPAAELHRSIVGSAVAAQVEAYYAEAGARSRSAADLAMLWVRSVLVVNGGAIVGLTTLVTTKPEMVSSPSGLGFSFALFGASAIIVLAALFVGYLGEINIATADTEFADDRVDELVQGRLPKKPDRKTSRMWVAALLVAIASLGTLAGGLASALESLSLAALV